MAESAGIDVPIGKCSSCCSCRESWSSHGCMWQTGVLEIGECQWLPGDGRSHWDFSTPSQLFRCHCTRKFQWTVGFVEVVWADTDMVGSRMGFGVVVSHVFLSGVPSYVELVAGDLVGNPEVAHFHGTGTLALNGVVGNAGSGGIVAVDWCRRLWVA